MKLLKLLSVIFVFSIIACSSDDEDPQLKNIRVCNELNNNECDRNQSVLPANSEAIYTSAELVAVKDANVNVVLWAWDGQDWLQLTQTTINNGNKNIINVTFRNQNEWAATDYEIEYYVDTDPELTGYVSFSVN